MVVPRRILILAFGFLYNAASGGLIFTVFRWIGDQNPPHESLQLGLVSAAGSLAYMITCLGGAPLRKRLYGNRIVVLGLILGSIALALLKMNYSVLLLYPLWAMTMVSFAITFPSVIAWTRQGRTGRDLRRTIFLVYAASMSGMTTGIVCSSWLYSLSPGYTGAGYVYMCGIAIHLLCLALLAVIPPRRSVPITEPSVEQPDSEEQVDPGITRTFIRIGWIGNMLLMLCVTALFSLFKKVTTDMQISPLMDALLIVGYRAAGIAVAAIMMLSTSWRYRGWSLALCSCMGVTGLCIIGLAESYWLFILGFSLVGVLTGHNYYWGVYYSLSSVSSSDTVGQVDRAAINDSFFAIGAIVGAAFGGWVGEAHVRLPYLLVAAVIILGLCWQILIIRRDKSRIGSFGKV